MKFNKLPILLLTVLFMGCERDDICAEGTPTTPQLLIEFFDVTDTELIKSVTRLSVYAETLITDDAGVITLPESASNATLLFNENSSSISLPLIVAAEGEETITRYYFEKDTNLRLDGNSATDSNIDILEIKYTPNFIYVSRACGFKSIFTELTAIENAGDDSIEWIQNTTLANTTEISITVENEDATHVQIFH